MQLARREQTGRLTDTIAGLAKLSNTRKARQLMQTLIVGRDITGVGAFA